MKKFISALALISMSSIGSANAANVAAAPEASAPPANELAALVAIRNELIRMQLNMPPARDSATTACKYEDKSYSEGAIRQVGTVGLVCVQRDWGEMTSPAVLVWEPITSQRIATYRRATRLAPDAK